MKFYSMRVGDSRSHALTFLTFSRSHTIPTPLTLSRSHTCPHLLRSCGLTILRMPTPLTVSRFSRSHACPHLLRSYALTFLRSAVSYIHDRVHTLHHRYPDKDFHQEEAQGGNPGGKTSHRPLSLYLYQSVWHVYPYLAFDVSHFKRCAAQE